jgi:energy-converting hydrogenase Eha subunit A
LLLDATVYSVMEHILPIVITFFYHCFILCDSYTDSVASGEKLCVDYIGVLFMVMSGLPVEKPKRFEFSVEIIFPTAKILIWFLPIQMLLIFDKVIFNFTSLVLFSHKLYSSQCSRQQQYDTEISCQDILHMTPSVLSMFQSVNWGLQ